jgi:gamma-glutamylaminecyclotransferase
VQVFVYGTLTDPDRVETVLGHVPDARYDLEESAVLEGLRRIEGEYPTLAPSGRVEGRLLAVDEAGLEALDRYEGVDRGLYERLAVPQSDESDDVWVYVGDPERLGVDERVDWPEGRSFSDRVERYVAQERVMVRRDE